MNECSRDGCQTVIDLYSKFYETLPEDRRDEFVVRKFQTYKERLLEAGYDCEDFLCLPLLKLIGEE